MGTIPFGFTDKCLSNKKGKEHNHFFYIFFISAKNNEINTMKYIIEEIIDKDIMKTSTNDENDTALHVAVKNDSHKVVSYLVKKCPQLLSIPDKDGYTPLYIAINKRDDPKVLEAMVEGMKGVSQAIEQNKSIIIAALERKKWKVYLEALHPLYKNNILKEAPDFPLDKSSSPLSFAVESGNWDMVKYLLENFSFLKNIGDKNDAETRYPIHQVLKIKDIKTLGKVVEIFKSLASESIGMQTAKKRDNIFHLAARNNPKLTKNQLECLKEELLPKYQKLLEETNTDNETPLNVAENLKNQAFLDCYKVK